MKLTKEQREHAKNLHRAHTELFNAAYAVHNGAISERLVDAALAFTEAFTDEPLRVLAKKSSLKPVKLKSVKMREV